MQDQKTLPSDAFFIDDAALKNLKLVAVAYSHVDRADFATEGAYDAEAEVEERAEDVIAQIAKLGLPVKGYPADKYFFTNILVDKPDLVLNLVDTVRGRDALQPAIPGALELSDIQYTGAGMRGLVIGNDRHLFKQLLNGHDIPTPPYKFIRDMRSKIPEELGVPLIVKLNESGGSVGIDNKAVKETMALAEKKVAKMIETYKIPVIVEKFVDGPEITAVVYDDGRKKHIFLGQKVFHIKPDGKHDFTSLESYEDIRAYTYKVPDQTIQDKITPLVSRAFDTLGHRDYAKFDIRWEESTSTPFFIDCNPNTAFGPDKGLPMTEVLALHKVDFATLLKSLLSKHAKSILKAA
jgi:D-alanine-D-alanine ligase-like ATP-grasp enzyme